MFYDILERKNNIFPKGLVHGFGPKLAIFPTFFLGTIAQENMFHNILELKKQLSRLKSVFFHSNFFLKEIEKNK